MSGKIVGLHGDYEAQPAQANATVIAELERLLAAAKSGEIIGLAGSYMHRAGIVTWSYAGAVGGYGHIGGLECAKEKLVRIALAGS